MMELPCEICAVSVKIGDAQRFLEMVRARRKPLCRQCRRYASRKRARRRVLSRKFRLTD